MDRALTIEYVPIKKLTPYEGLRGKLLFTITGAHITQRTTQKNAGGMADMYLAMATWYKSFFSVLYAPSCVSIQMMGDKARRVHHRVEWEHCAPKILDERWQK